MGASRFYLKTAFEQWIFAKSVSAWAREAANGGQREGERGKKQREIRRSRMIVAGEGRTGLQFLGLQVLSSRPEKSRGRKTTTTKWSEAGIVVQWFPPDQFPVFTILLFLLCIVIILQYRKNWAVSEFKFWSPLLKRSDGRHFVSILRFFVLLPVS